MRSLQQTEASRGVIMCTHGLCAPARQQALIDADSVQSREQRTAVALTWANADMVVTGHQCFGSEDGQTGPEKQRATAVWGSGAVWLLRIYTTKIPLYKTAAAHPKLLQLCIQKKNLRENSTLILIFCDHLWCLSSSTALGFFSYVSHNAFQ